MADPGAEERGEQSGGNAGKPSRAAPEESSNVRVTAGSAGRVDRFYNRTSGPPPTARIFRSLAEIVDEVETAGTLRLDWSYLQRAYFPDDSVEKFRAWAESHRLTWRLEEYDRGRLEKGYTVVFSRAVRP